MKYFYKDFCKRRGFVTLNECIDLHGSIPHCHDFFEIVYIRKGEGQYFENGVKSYLSEGDVIIIGPKDIHELVPATRDFAWSNCLFLPEEIYDDMPPDGDVLQLLNLPRFGDNKIKPEDITKGVHIKGRGNEFKNIIKEMKGEYLSGQQGYQKILENMLDILLLRIKRCFMDKKVTTINMNDANQLGVFMKRFLCDSTSVPVVKLEAIAREAGVSAKYFSEAFKKTMGVTFSEYVKEIRLKQAENFLKQTSVNIATIMEYIGYRDTKTFYKVFRQKYGCSPNQYRKNFADKQ